MRQAQEIFCVEGHLVMYLVIESAGISSIGGGTSCKGGSSWEGGNESLSPPRGLGYFQGFGFTMVSDGQIRFLLSFDLINKKAVVPTKIRVPTPKAVKTTHIKVSLVFSALQEGGWLACPSASL